MFKGLLNGKESNVLKEFCKFATLNYASWFFYSSIISTGWIKSNEGLVYGDFHWRPDNIQVESKEDTIDALIVNDDLDARDFLNLSSSVVYRFSGKDTTCRYLSEAIYDFYIDLVKKKGKDDFLNKVRFVGDLPMDGHCWLQILENDKWVDYETQQWTKTLTIDNVKKYSDDTRLERRDVNTDEDVHFKTIPGTKIVTQVPESVLRCGGTVGSFLRFYLYEKKA